jgi:murein DD-endopeptidase MepM/ murein hydrolase activator NlpD
MLSVCGASVSNAPLTDGSRRIVGFTPSVEIRGRVLSRAPVAGCLSSGYGERVSEGGVSRMHNGLDLYTGAPAPVFAAGDGVVEFTGSYRGYGETILIRHGAGVKTRYAHLSAYAGGIRVGERVRAGQVIGETGRTGNASAVHLHYEIIVDERAENPLTVGS